MPNPARAYSAIAATSCSSVTAGLLTALTDQIDDLLERVAALEGGSVPVGALVDGTGAALVDGAGNYLVTGA